MVILAYYEAGASKHLESSSQRSPGRDKMEAVVDDSMEEKPLFEAKPPKLKFPKFSGEDPTVWIRELSNTLIFRTHQSLERYHWPYFIWMERLMNGCNG